jgi:hypothetical protein
MRAPPEKSGVFGIKKYAESSEPSHLCAALENCSGNGVMNARPLINHPPLDLLAAGGSGVFGRPRVRRRTPLRWMDRPRKRGVSAEEPGRLGGRRAFMD